MARTLPMFPLGSVLLPGMVLPLHIFEPRYRELIHQCIESPEHDFGVVLIARGAEVGGDDVRTDVGTRARLRQISELPDGRYAVVAVGVERIRVLRWLPDNPYPVAEVEVWPDLPAAESNLDDLSARVASTASRVRRCAALALELGDAVGDPATPLVDDPSGVVYQLAMLAPIGPLDRYKILLAPDPPSRLEVLDGLLDDVEALLRWRLETGSE
jgi:uncharacterized protein